MHAYIAVATWVAMLVPAVLGTTIRLVPTVTNGTIVVEKTSVAGNLDGLKMTTTANRTSADFWYFDGQSTTPGNNAAVEIVFFNSGDIKTPHPLAVQVTGVFANGTRFHRTAMANDGVTFTSDENGIRGEWKGAGASFTGTPLDKPDVTYHITIDSEEAGVKGTFTLKSRAPSHYPCDVNVPGVSETLLPTLFWANAVPDADATIDVAIDGVPLNITDAIGYHDKNWGDASVITSPKFWDWGHARFGPYSAVWFDVLDKSDAEFPYAYVAKDGKVIHKACGAGAVQVRQWGANASYPPTVGLNDVPGVTVRFPLDNGQTLVANLTKTVIALDEIAHQRANALVQGGIEGCGKKYQGHAHFEEFIFGLL